MDTLTITLVASASTALLSGGLATVIVKGLPERRNLQVDTSQKAVALLAQTMDELAEQLAKAAATIADMQADFDEKLAVARSTIGDLQAKLEQTLERAHQLEGLLAAEQTKVEILSSKLRAHPAT